MTFAPRLARTGAAAALLLLGACSKETPASPEPGGDPLIAKLQAANRAAPPRGNPVPGEDPNAELARIAAAGADDAAQERKLPEKNVTVALGPLAIRLAGVSSSQVVQGPRLSLTTDERFVVVRLLVQNMGKERLSWNPTGAELRVGEERFGLARDAQRTAGTRELEHLFAPGSAQDRLEYVLIFEVPPALLGRGLALHLPGTDGGADALSVPIE